MGTLAPMGPPIAAVSSMQPGPCPPRKPLNCSLSGIQWLLKRSLTFSDNLLSAVRWVWCPNLVSVRVLEHPSRHSRPVSPGPLPPPPPSETTEVAICSLFNGTTCICLNSSKIEISETNSCDIMTTHNDQTSHVKHALDPFCVFFTHLGKGFARGSLSKGLMDALLMLF